MHYRTVMLAVAPPGFAWVAFAGDVNGDGFADVIIGPARNDANGVYSAGASYVVFGSASGFAANTDASTLDGTANQYRQSRAIAC